VLWESIPLQDVSSTVPQGQDTFAIPPDKGVNLFKLEPYFASGILYQVDAMAAVWGGVMEQKFGFRSLEARFLSQLPNNRQHGGVSVNTMKNIGRVLLMPAFAGVEVAVSLT
jgi:hypothetical protein